MPEAPPLRGPRSKNEQCGNEAVTTAAAAHLPRVTEVALSEVEGCASWFLRRLVTLHFRIPLIRLPQGNEICYILQPKRHETTSSLLNKRHPSSAPTAFG